jgi:hypothetical protein
MMHLDEKAVERKRVFELVFLRMLPSAGAVSSPRHYVDNVRAVAETLIDEREKFGRNERERQL